MENNKVIEFKGEKESPLPINAIEFDESTLIRIPIFERIYQMDGELYYELTNGRVPRKLKDYKLEDFN